MTCPFRMTSLKSPFENIHKKNICNNTTNDTSSNIFQKLFLFSGVIFENIKYIFQNSFLIQWSFSKISKMQVKLVSWHKHVRYFAAKAHVSQLCNKAPRITDNGFRRCPIKSWDLSRQLEPQISTHFNIWS